MRLPRAPRFVVPLALLVAAAGAALGLAEWLVLVPEATDRLRDDAYYEFAWAANVAAGRGPMVSDGTTTSGVQLLWCLLLVPCAGLFGAASLPLLAPWLGFVLHATAASLLCGAVRDRAAGACVGLWWLGHPLLLRECQNGQETALAAFLAVLLWRLRRCAERPFLVVGLLAVLARSDLWPLLAALSWWRHRGAPARGVPTPALALAVHTAANLVLGGGPFPDSAMPMAWLWHANFATTGPGVGAWLAQQWWFLRPVLLGGPWAMVSAMGCGLATWSLLRSAVRGRLRVVPLLLVAAAAAAGARDLEAAAVAAALLAVWPAAGRRPVRGDLLAAAVGLGAILVLHWAVRWYPRDYYAAPAVLVAALAVQRWGRVRLLLLACVTVAVFEGRRLRPEPLAGQQEMQMAGLHLASVLPAGERIGCFNSGLVTFFADAAADPARRRGIVNLDGVVDARSFAALRRGALGAWLDAEGIRFLLDNPVQFSADPAVPHACGRWFGGGFDAARDLAEIARFDVPGVGNGRPGGDSFRLYWRVGRGERPAVPTSPRDLGPDRHGRCVLWPARTGQVLEVELADGSRRGLATADADTVFVVHLAAGDHGTGRLFVRGAALPLLTLPPL